jgi:hypothetical protein
MRRILYLFQALLLVSFLSCQSDKAGSYYDEKSNNRVKKILVYENRLYILGQRIMKEGTMEYHNALLCTDTLFNKIWDKKFGDHSNGEFLEDFCIDKKGNFFLVGYNQSKKLAFLIKCNPLGETSWRKDFPEVKRFGNIRMYRDSALVLAGTRAVKDTTLINDSGFVQKTDLEGNLQWRKPLALDIGLRFLEIWKDKIILTANTGQADYSLMPQTKTFCLNAQGDMDWVTDLDGRNTGIEKGVKTLNMRIDPEKGIYILCQSHNNFLAGIKIIQLNEAGQKINEFATDINTVLSNKCAKSKGTLFMTADVALSSPQVQSEPAALCIKRDVSGTPYFCSMPAKPFLVDFVQLGQTTFTVGNISDPQKFFCYWKLGRYQ